MTDHPLENTLAAGEEEYFFEHNRALIERKRKELEAQRARLEAEHRKNTHWMKCPKCGHDLKEIELLGILVDQCTSCSGVYFDRPEIEILIESQGPKGFLSGLSRLFK
ncbi:MAG: zf-TFIIB domain-containing protein [Candidatus Omnitrophica bacterium]|nr:zf-TFIIB domain-containing protein [Candidatus Omnitrophota bacterium]